MVVVADLVARVRAEGVQETAQQVRAVGASAQETARALELMAQAASRANPNQGNAAQILELFQRANVQPTAAALAQARTEMEKVASSATQAVAPSQAVARAARDHAEASTNGARAAQNVAEGWKLSESSLVRFGAGLAGINLGISLVAGAARLVHDAIESIVVRQLDWERSLRTLSGLYGQVGGQAAAVATAQASLPGVLGTQQEFAQAAINASALRFRYGLPQETIDQLVTTGGRVAYATGLTDATERQQLQAQILSAVQTGAPLPPQYRTYTDPEAVARAVGLQGAQSLQAFTPQELIGARAAIVSQGLTTFVDQANANQRTALDMATRAEKAVQQAQDAIQRNLEAPSPGAVQGPTVAERSLTRSILEYGQPEPEPPPPTPYQVQPAANIAGLAAIDAERNVMQATETYVRALADSTRVQEENRKKLEDFTKTVDYAGARVLGFFGSLEDTRSLAHGDILAQGQAAITARSRSAVPAFGMEVPEVNAIARGTTSAQLWQNFVSLLAQNEDTDPIRRNLQQYATSGTDAQRTAAQRVLSYAGPLDAANRGLGAAQTRAAGIDIQTAETQAQLDRISLQQRERQIQLLRDTVDLRRLDIQLQQTGVRATEDAVRAQQSLLPVQAITSAGQYDQRLAGAISRQRMARLLQGQDVSGLPSLNDLINQNYRGQLIEAENEPALVRAQRGVEVAGQAVTAASLAQTLTESQLRLTELANEARNLDDLPLQTAYELQLIDNNRDQLSVQTEMREYLKALVYYMTQAGRTPLPVPADRGDRIDAANAPRAPSELAGARR